MDRSSSSPFRHFQPSAPSGRRSSRTRGISDFLRANEKLARLLPSVARLASIQKDCEAILPSIFEVCAAVQFEGGQLVIATPNAAFASKLKQNLPKLQENLTSRGWQVDAIRLKVQVGKMIRKEPPRKQISLPPRALSALAGLHESLEESRQNAPLKAALAAMLRRHAGSAGKKD